MKTKLRFIFILGLFIACYLLRATSCYSFGNFSISYDIIYNVKESGITQVNQTISLKNKTSDYYATEYTLVLIGQDVNKVNAFDSLGSLKKTVKKDGDRTLIHVFFNEEVAGIDKILKWNLSYETPSLVFKNGLVWEITLPGLPKQEDLENYNVTLFFPDSFGPLLYISPLPKTNFFWTKNEMSFSGITASFGKYQIFDFKLLYHLNNPKLIPVVTEITLPPDTAYQKVNYSKIDPKPEDVKVDKDNNWLAKYNLSPKEKIEIEVIGHAKIFFNPQNKEPLSEEQIKTYLLPKKFWETEAPEIKNLANELKTPKAIYDFVVSSLKYDYQKTEKKPERLGALNTLKNKDKAICLEFTDLFVALSRAAGIPARAINGYAYTTNPKLRPLSEKFDILHAWPEYYDSLKKNWIMVDPTWGNTTGGLDFFSKLDLNHFVFVKKGVSSTYPHPPGSYKDGGNQKDILVSFSEFDKEIKEGSLEVYFLLPKKSFLIFPIEGKIKLINSGQGALKLNNLKIETKPEVFKQILSLGIIPPYGKSEIPVNINLLSGNFKYLTTKPEVLTLNLKVKNDEYSHKIEIMPVIFYLLIGGLCVIITIVAITARETWNLYLQRKKQ